MRYFGMRPSMWLTLALILLAVRPLMVFADTNISGSVINQSIWNNTTITNPPGNGSGTGTVYVGVWSSSSEISGPPAYNDLVAGPGALPFSGLVSNYVVNLVPAGDYLVVAWIDGDADAGYDIGEPRSVSSSVTVSSNAVVGINLIIKDDLDSDTMPDWWEVHWFGDLDEIGTADTDGDGLTDVQEYNISQTYTNLALLDPSDWDTDDDKMDDGWEYGYYAAGTGTDPCTSDAYADPDGDGLVNIQEYKAVDSEPPKEQDPTKPAGIAHANGDDTGDALNAINIDSDSDYLIDSFEAAWYDPANGINPNSAGTHSADSDKDGLTSYREQCLLAELRENGSNGVVWSAGAGALPVADANGLRDFSPKLILGATNSTTIKGDLAALRGREWTDPTDGTGYSESLDEGWDTDNDLLPDGWEVEFNLNPRNWVGTNGYFGDPDGDGLVNFQEYNGQDGDRAVTNEYLNGTGDETNPNEHNWRPNSTGPGPGTCRPTMESNHWFNYGFSPTNGTLGAALPTASMGTDSGANSDDDDYSDDYEIQQEFIGGYIGSSPVHSMHPFTKRAALITSTNGIVIPDPEGSPSVGYCPLIHERNWTIECQVKITSTNVSGYLINCPGPYGTGDVAWRLELSNAIPRVSFDTLGTQRYYVAGMALPTNQWIHLAGVWDTDANSLSLYVDGIFVQEQRIYEESLSAYLYACASSPTIGRALGGSFTNRVYIDEVRIWGTARTPTQIEEYRTKLVPQNATNLLAYYRFDDGGVTAEDFARKAKNGLIGAASQDYYFGDHGYALSNGFTFVTNANDYANIRGISPRGADDTDGDLMPDAWEMVNLLDLSSTNGSDGATGDPDSDTLKNIYEFWSEANPNAQDTDTDGTFDRNEDYDSDGVVNKMEQDLNSRPDIVDTDDDGRSDNDERMAGTSPVNPTDPGISRCMWFDGSGQDYLLIPNAFKQRLTDWTIEAWISPSNITDGVGTIVRRVVETPASGTNAVNFVLGVETNAGGLRPYAGYTFANGTNYIVRGANLAQPTNWTHIAASYDSFNAVLTLYTNGAISGTPVSNAYVSPPINGKGGETFVRIGEDFRGYIDEVRIWNDVRTITEISTNYNETIDAQQNTNLIHYFRFDDGQAVTNASFPTFGEFHQPHGAQDFTYSQDWNEQWIHAAVSHGSVEFVFPGAVVAPPSLTVILQPTAAVTAGAQWSLDGGGWRDSASTAESLDEGSHSIVYKSLSGWTAPTNETIVLTNGMTETITRTYVQNGSLKVSLEPLGARDGGAQWAVDGGSWQISDAAVSNLSVGSHTVSYLTISGWTAPSNNAVTISEASQTVIVSWYTEITGSIQMYIMPTGVVATSAQWRVDSGSWTNNGATVSGLSTGLHIASFSDVAGWITPSNQSFNISNSAVLISTGVYTRATQLQVFLYPALAVSSGAQWRVDSGPWLNSGVTTNMTAGTNTVLFKAVSGWAEPAPRSVVITNQALTTLSVLYYQMQILGGEGTQLGTFNKPRGVAIDQRYLYVADSDNNRIQRLDTVMDTWTNYGSLGTAAGQFHQPYGVTLDSNGDLWVADAGNNRIQKMTVTSGVWTAWGSAGEGLGEFYSPFDIDIDSVVNVYVVDSYNYRVQKKTPGGAWSNYVTNGPYAGEVKFPAGIAVSQSDMINISDYDFPGGPGRIQRFDTNGSYQATVGSATNSEGQLNRPMGMDFYGNDVALFVADAGNSRLQKRDMTGSIDPPWIVILGSNILNQARDVAVDTSGNVYVADTENNRVLKLPATDSDGDGLSDSMEFDYGTDSSSADSDSDGQTDADELVAGTNPNSATNYFSIQTNQWDAAGEYVIISWYSVVGRLYTVRIVTNLLSSGWSSVPDFVRVQGTGSTMSYTNTAPTAGPEFYKIKVELAK